MAPNTQMKKKGDPPSDREVYPNPLATPNSMVG